MSESKPCPFCGREPEIAHRGGAFGFKCLCAGTRFVHAYGKTEEAAKLNWNIRFFHVPQSVSEALAAKDAEISKLREALSNILGYDRNFYDNGRPGYEAIARAALAGGAA